MSLNPQTVGQALSQVALGEKTVLDISGPVGDAPGKIAFQLERLPRVLAKTPPRQHHFSAIDGFVAYLTKIAPNAVVIMQMDNGATCAVLDESRENGVEVVSFTPESHPTFKAWAALFGRQMSIRDLATFIQKQRRSIADGPALASLFRQIKASTSTELHAGNGNGAVNGLLVSTKIQGKDADKEVTLPETLIIETPLFIDSAHAAKIELDLCIEGAEDGKKVLATLTAPTLDVLRFEELKEYAAKFKAFQFGFGHVAHGVWKLAE